MSCGADAVALPFGAAADRTGVAVSACPVVGSRGTAIADAIRTVFREGTDYSSHFGDSVTAVTRQLRDVHFMLSQEGRPVV